MKSGMMHRQSRALALLGALACGVLGTTQMAQAAPEKLAIFYGPPKKVNGAHSNPLDSYQTKIDKAVAAFDDYDLVVFPEGAEQPDSPSNPEPDLHSTTTDIIQGLPATTRVFGYIDTCVENIYSEIYRCRNHSLAALEDRVDAWSDMGAKGIFLDQAGCDYQVTRQRLNSIVDYIHSKDMSAFVNVWDQDHAFSPYDDATFPGCNDPETATHLGPDDYTLLESWVLQQSEYVPAEHEKFIGRAETALSYKNQYGTKVATVNTLAVGNPNFDQRQLDYVWWTTVLYGFDAMAWGETWLYSADSHELPLRSRPNVALGTSSTPLTVTHAGDLHRRTTSAGTILVDTAGHTGRLVGKNVVTQPTLKPTDLLVSAATFTATDVTLSATSNIAPIVKFQFFIDSDNNPATGFLHSDEGLTTVGADYLVDNEDVYSFTGANQTTWSWQLVAPVSPSGVGTRQVAVSVALSQIGYTSGIPLRLLAKSSTSNWQPLDFLPRAPAAAWSATPSAYTQTATQATDLSKGDVAFAEYKGTTELTFHMYANGPISGYRALIDSDNNPATGHNFWGLNALGADYLVENGYLLRFTGQHGTQDWSWSTVSAARELVHDSGLPQDGRDTAHVHWSILPERIGFGPGEQIAVLLQHSLRTAPYTEYDYLPRVAAGPDTWKISYNAAQQEAGPDTLVYGDTAFSTNAITFTLKSNGGAINAYRVFIDRDNSSSTGYRHTEHGITGTGAEYLIEDGQLYQFCGTSQTQWCWNYVSNNVTDAGYGSSEITVEVPKASISYVTGSTIALVGENWVSANESLDHLIRSANTVWRATP